MKVRFLGSFMFLLFLTCTPEGNYFENAICIENINTIDAKKGLQNHMTVIIKDDLIIKVEKSSKLKLDETNVIIDGTDKYLIPGLWDAHVHFAYMEELAPRMFDLFLIHGITSVRDTGGKLDVVKKWKKLSEEDTTNSPRVMIAGPLIDGTPTVYDGSNPGRPPLATGSATIEEVEALVTKLHAEGVDLLKAYEMLSPEQFMVVMDMAEKKGLKVTGHIPLSMDAVSVSNAGLHSMEHLRNLEMSCAANSDELLAERKQLLYAGKEEAGMDLRSSIHKAQKVRAIKNQSESRTEEVLNTLAKNDTWQVPTLALNTILTRDHVTRADWRKTFEFLPDSTAEKWLAGSKRIAAMEEKEEWAVPAKWAMEMIKKINDKEIGIMAGTDTPIAYLTPGYSLHEELAVMVASGLTPLEALETATLNPAIYFNMENQLGLIEKGFIADLVLLEKNPLVHIENTKAIHAVFKSGKMHTSQEISETAEILRKK